MCTSKAGFDAEVFRNKHNEKPEQKFLSWGDIFLVNLERKLMVFELQLLTKFDSNVFDAHYPPKEMFDLL